MPQKRILEVVAINRGGTDGKTSGGGAAGTWDGPSIHYCHTHRHKYPHPSFKCPEPNTGHIKNATKKDTRGSSDKEKRKNDNITYFLATR